MMTKQEREGLASLCIWNGDENSATFHAFNACLYHLVASTCETAGIQKSSFILTQEKDIRSKIEFDVLNIDIGRLKIDEEEKPLKTYPRQDCIKTDLHFVIAYMSIMNKGHFEDSNFLFPAFEKELGNNGEIDAKQPIFSKFMLID
mgnify:CR=1 FL=1